MVFLLLFIISKSVEGYELKFPFALEHLFGDALTSAVYSSDICTVNKEQNTSIYTYSIMFRGFMGQKQYFLFCYKKVAPGVLGKCHKVDS
jgi:hypothetical protein